MKRKLRLIPFDDNSAKLGRDLEYYSTKTYSERVTARLKKAIRYMEEWEKHRWLTSFKTSTIKNTIRQMKLERITEYNTTPESEAYWCA